MLNDIPDTASSPLRLSLRRKEIPLVLEDEAGVPVSYTLREMTGEERDLYLNASQRRLEISGDGKLVKVKDFNGLHSDLISMCLYDAKNQKVPPKFVQSWPAPVQGQVFKLAQDLSGLGKGAGDEAKND